MTDAVKQPQAANLDRIDQMLVIAKKSLESNLQLQDQMDALCAAFLNPAMGPNCCG